LTHDSDLVAGFKGPLHHKKGSGGKGKVRGKIKKRDGEKGRRKRGIKEERKREGKGDKVGRTCSITPGKVDAPSWRCS